MAVLEVLPGVEVTICVDEEPLEEYDAENDEIEHDDEDIIEHQEERTVTKYIEATTAKAFMVQLAVQDPFKMDCASIQFYTEVDGKWIDSTLMLKEDYHDEGEDWKEEVRGPINRQGQNVVVSTLEFAKIKVSSEKVKDPIIDKQTKLLSKVGNIIVEVSRRCVRDKINRSDVNHRTLSRAVNYEETFHQKAVVMENQSHGIKYGATKAAGNVDMYNTESLDGADYFIGRFHFKYRSQSKSTAAYVYALQLITRGIEEALKELLVMPRTPSPTPEPGQAPAALPTPRLTPGATPTPRSAGAGAARTPQQIIEDTMAEQQRHLAELASSLGVGVPSAIKTETEPSVNIKHENDEGEFVRRPKKKSKHIGKMLIDLTEDSEDEMALPSMTLE